MTCTCSLATRLEPEALEGLSTALTDAHARKPEAESLNALSRRLGLRKEVLIRHRDQCLGLPAQVRPSVVYFIQHGTNGPVKIGFTTQPIRSRLHTLQIGNPVQLHVLASYSGGEEQEAGLHSEFDHLRMHGEWFRPGEDILSRAELCSSLCEGPLPVGPPAGDASYEVDITPLLERFLELAV